MNSARPIIRRILPICNNNTQQRIIITHQQQSPAITQLLLSTHITSSSHSYYSTTTPSLALKPGTPITGLENIYPPSKKDPTKDRTPIAKPRSEYPPWVNELTKPLPTLAKLRAMKIEDATDRDMKRYLKLVRRAKIKANNEERRKK